MRDWRIYGEVLIVAASVGGMAAQPPPKAPSEPELKWVVAAGQPGAAHVEVSGVPRQTLDALKGGNWPVSRWQKLMPVYAEFSEGAETSQVPPMLGRYWIQEDGFAFEPAFKLTGGIKYRAVLRLAELPRFPGGKGLRLALYAPPVPPRLSTTVVSQVYPTAGVLPENLLKFYVQFSAPMSRGRVYDHIRLLTEAGKKVELAFLEIDEELWDPGLRRLTLFIDPGRIKRGVKPLEEVGPALQEKGRFTLEVDREMPDGQGNPLREGYRKSFLVGPPDRVPPDPSRWKLKTPRAGGRDKLTVEFGEPLDHALSRRLIVLADSESRPVSGRAGLLPQESGWSFVPEDKWAHGSYRLVVGAMLEDLAGNSVGRPFEVDLFDNIDPGAARETVVIDVSIPE